MDHRERSTAEVDVIAVPQRDAGGSGDIPPLLRHKVGRKWHRHALAPEQPGELAVQAAYFAEGAELAIGIVEVGAEDVLGHLNLDQWSADLVDRDSLKLVIAADMIEVIVSVDHLERRVD